jgi:predicted dehydrogenase
MSGRILELGLVGYGQLARKYYVPALRLLHDVRISVVVDPLDSSLEAARRAFPGVAVGSDPCLLLSRRLDGAIVASPPSTHISLWNLAAKAGLPVLLEKPFVLRGELRHAAAAEGMQRLLMLDLNRRFWPPYRRIRESVRAGLIGDLQKIELWLQVDVAPWCSVTSHRLKPREGGVLYDLGSQAIDLAHWIAGREPSQVLASTESRRWDQDHVFLQLRFQGGLQAECQLAYSQPGIERLVVTGSDGEFRLENPNMAIHCRRPRQAGPRLSSRGRDLLVLGYRGLRRSRSMMRYSVASVLAAFTQSLRHGLPFSPGFDDAVANASWLDAAALAIELGGPRAPSAAGSTA